MAFRAASEVICDYCEDRIEVGDVLTAFSLALSAPDSAFEIASNEELSYDDRVLQLTEHPYIMSEEKGIKSWDREKTTQLVAILLIYFATAREP